LSELKKNGPEYSAAADWVSFKPEIQILDCTIRDGGLMNDHNFDDKVIRSIYNACVEAGIDYLELGYKGDGKIYAPTQYGPWKFCREEDMRRIVGDNDTPLKLSVMADATRTDYKTDILPKSQSVVDMVRVSCYIHEIPTALDMIKDSHDKGYETTVNLMAISTVPEPELDSAMRLLADSEVSTLYVVDSFGSLYSEHVHYLVKKYLQYGKKVGMHAHNNQELAFANTIEAIIHGATIVDGSMAGLGRGAGNCRTESLLGFLHNPKFKLRPVLGCIQEHIEPLRDKLLWGFDIPYMLTGVLNQHPRSAIKFNFSQDKGNYLLFFEKL